MGLRNQEARLALVKDLFENLQQEGEQIQGSHRNGLKEGPYLELTRQIQYLLYSRLHPGPKVLDSGRPPGSTQGMLLSDARLLDGIPGSLIFPPAGVLGGRKPDSNSSCCFLLPSLHSSLRLQVYKYCRIWASNLLSTVPAWCCLEPEG